MERWTKRSFDAFAAEVQSVPERARRQRVEWCAYCKRAVYHPQPGRVIVGDHGYAILRWNAEAPLYDGIPEKRAAYRLLFALRHGWSSVRMPTRNGGTRIVNLQEYWSQTPVKVIDTRPPLIIRRASANASTPAQSVDRSRP